MRTKEKSRKPTPQEAGQETRHFVYSCPGLDLWSIGRTKEEAENKLRQEMQLLWMRCSKYDDLEPFIGDSAFATVEIRPS